MVDGTAVHQTPPVVSLLSCLYRYDISCLSHIAALLSLSMHIPSIYFSSLLTSTVLEESLPLKICSSVVARHLTPNSLGPTVNSKTPTPKASQQSSTGGARIRLLTPALLLQLDVGEVIPASSAVNVNVMKPLTRSWKPRPNALISKRRTLLLV